MKQEFEKIEMKEVYVAPKCECVEVYSEGILCASDPTNVSNGVFDSVGDSFVGEW